MFVIVIIIKLFILVALVKVLIETNQPLACSGTFAIVSFVFGFGFDYPWLLLLVTTTLAFVTATVYFWLLDRLEGSGIFWWGVLILGTPIAVL